MTSLTITSTPVEDFTLVRIIGQNDFNDVAPLYRNPEITRWIRDGRPWDDHKIHRYLDHFAKENYLVTGFIDYKIVVDGITIGIVGFRTDFSPARRDRFYQGRPFISILIDPSQQGRGYATRALTKAIQEYNSIFPTSTDFYSYIDTNNIGSIRVHEKVGFLLTRTFSGSRYQPDHVLMTYSLSGQKFSTLYDQGYTQETLIPIITQWITSKTLGFPFASTFLPTSDVMMENYTQSTVKVSNSPYDGFKSYHSVEKLFLPPTFYQNGTETYYMITSDHYPDYFSVNGLTDRYIEDQRIKSKKLDAPMSTEQCWNDPNCVERIASHIVNSFPSYINKNMRDSVFSVSRDPGLFKLMWVRGLLQALVPSLLSIKYGCRMLDISAGWGDRLLGALAHNCEYLGFDPNTALKPGHDNMIKDFGNSDHQRVVYQPFEDADLSHEDPFDICITSPPFFNIEIYSDQSTQSTEKYPGFNDWMVGFLFTSLVKVWDKLKYNGYLAIHMGDVGGHNINEPMLLFIEQYLTGSSYHGVIGVGGDGSIAPVWIWKKVGNGTNVRKWSSFVSPSPSDRLLTDLYPELASLYLQNQGIVDPFSRQPSQQSPLSIQPRLQQLSLTGTTPLSPSFVSALPETSSQNYHELASKLDPTVEPCRVKDSFAPTTQDPFIPIPQPQPFVLSNILPLTAQIETHSSEDVKNLDPSSSLIDVTKYQQLLRIKDMFNRFDANQFDRARNFTNPFENIGNSIFMNRAAVKIANIDAVFNFTQRKGGLLGPQELGPLRGTSEETSLLQIEGSDGTEGTEGTEGSTNLDRRLGYNFCDIASAPGGFSEYIQYRFPVSYGWGMSIRSGLKWNTDKLDMDRFNILWGSDNTGNLYTNADWFSEQVRSNNTEGVDLVMADGGFDVSAGDDFNRQEFLSTRLIINELLVSLSVLGKNGVFVCKVFDTVTSLMAEVLFIMASAYKEFSIFKPMSSRPGNAERYIVCKYPRPEQISSLIGILRRVNASYSDHNNVTKILADGTLTEDFLKYLRDSNEQSVDLQIATGSNILRYLDGHNVSLPKYDLTRSLLYWNLPDNPMIRRAFRNVGRGIGIRQPQLESLPSSFPERAGFTERSPGVPSPDIITRETAISGPMTPTQIPSIMSPGRRPMSPPKIASPSQISTSITGVPTITSGVGEGVVSIPEIGSQMLLQVPTITTPTLTTTTHETPVLGTTTLGDDKTYIVRTDQFVPEEVEALFMKRGWNKNPEGKIPTFVYEDGNFLMWNKKNPEKGTYKGTTIVKTTMGESRKLIADKANLYHTTEGKYMPIQYDIQPNPTERVFLDLASKLFSTTRADGTGKVWIVRPVERWFFGGKGIFIVTSMEQLRQGIRPNTKYVVSEYIDNPLLWLDRDNQMYKFHLRIYVLYGTDRQFVYDPELVFVYPSDSPYVKGQYENKDIHDTHYIEGRVGTLNTLCKMYPGQCDSIKSQVQEIIRHTLGSIVPDTYPEVTHAVQLFGFDIMFNDLVQGYLIEVNDGVGLKEVPMERLINHTIDSAERLLQPDKKTYYVRSEWYGTGPNQLPFEHVFMARGWQPASQNLIDNTREDMKIGLVYEDGEFTYKDNTYRGPSIVKSSLDDSKEAIVDKNKLYQTLNGRHMLKQYFLPKNGLINTLSNIFSEYPVWIVKPVGSGFYSGKGISVVTNFDELTRSINPRNNYVIAQYLNNPLLYDGKKFHIRVLTIVGSDSGYTLLKSLNEVYPAILPYQSGQYDNKNIHDTHFVSHIYTGKEQDLVERFGQERTDSINNQIEAIVQDTVNSFQPKPYSESDFGFEIFGYDFLVDDTYKVYLIEVNRKVGLEGYDPDMLFGAVIDTSERLMG